MSNLRWHPLEQIWNGGSARDGRVKRVYIVAGGRKPKGKAGSAAPATASGVRHAR